MTNDESAARPQEQETKSATKARLCSYFGNPWIGMFIKTTNDVTILPVDSMEKVEQKVREQLGTETMRISMGSTNLLGIYTALNSNGMVLPNVATEEETQLLKEHGFNVHISKEKNNAHGNNIAVNDKGGIINPNVLPEERKKMEDVLGVELVPMEVARFSTVGSACLATNKGFLAHYATNEKQMEDISSVLKVRGNKGTVNFGVGFVSLGIIVNKKGYIAGQDTTAHEMGRIEEALDLIS